MKIHVKIQNKTYEVEIGDIHARPIQVKVDKETFEVWPEEMTTPLDSYHPSPITSSTQPLKSVSLEGSTASIAETVKQVKAPIPGVITSISIQEGDAVVYGQELCILEAMKMKNAIRSGRNGMIDKIFISEGDSVQHSQVLMEFAD